MVERSLVSFIFLMGGDGLRRRALARVRAARGAGPLRRLRRADADDGGRVGACATAWPRRSASCRPPSGSGPALGPIIGGAVAQLVGLRDAFLVTAVFYVVALVLVFVMYDERDGAITSCRRIGRAGCRSRSVLAFENFILLMAVIFGLQFVDRSFGPVLPLYVAELGTSPARVAAGRRAAVLDRGRRRRASATTSAARCCAGVGPRA